MSITADDALRDLPASVAPVLQEFVAAAREAFGDHLLSVVLFGSAADGTLRPTSDINVVLVLAQFDRAHADRLREPLRLAQAAIRLSAMFLLRDEIPAAANAFAQKFADIRRRRRVLHGQDPFATLAIPRSALVLRLEQVILNLTLRLRAAYVERGLREEQLVAALASAAGPLRTCAASLLELERSASRPPKQALEQVAASFGEGDWARTLARLGEAHERRLLPPGEAAETVLGLIELADRLRARVRAVG